MQLRAPPLRALHSPAFAVKVPRLTRGVVELIIFDGLLNDGRPDPDHPWEHVSAKVRFGMKTEVPSWDVMCWVKAQLWEPGDVVVQYHPAEADYVNMHPHVLHLWRPLLAEVPTPPADMQAINTPADAIAALQTVVEKKINLMLVRPDEVKLAAVKEVKQSLELIEKMRARYKLETDEQARPEGLSDAAAEEIALEELPAERLDAWRAAYVDALARAHTTETTGRLRETMTEADGDPFDNARSMLDRWEAERASTIALREVITAGGGVAVTVYNIAGFGAIWRTTGHSCAYCSLLDGRTVGPGERFLEAGESLEPEGEEPLKVGRAVGHPQAHTGCDCFVSAWRP